MQRTKLAHLASLLAQDKRNSIKRHNTSRKPVELATARPMRPQKQQNVLKKWEPGKLTTLLKKD